MISDIIKKQRRFFISHKTKKISFRIEQLKNLKKILKINEETLFEAIYKDFGKSKFDTVATELGIIYSDIDYYIKNINTLSQPTSVTTNLPNLIGKSSIYKDPFGVCLIIGAWNYPYQLSLCPAIAAIAAGNCVILKPSEVAPNTMKVMVNLINKHFNDDFFYAYEGGVEETTELLKHRFDKIFFTGSPKVGQIVYESAARHLTPVTLELGGKSPAIISSSANLKVAARRLVWGKFLNAGQTCIAPDYVVVHRTIEQKFLELLRTEIEKNNYSADCTHYTRIINTKNFNRLKSLLSSSNTYYGGNYDEQKLYIQPTVLHPVDWQDEVMKEEIFGPLLPVLVYDNFDDMLSQQIALEKPLAAYLFSGSKSEKKKFKTLLSFGGGCINDVIMHISNLNLPFGGVGQSGIGNYHGKFGFDAFTHSKSILDKATWGEPNIKYPPYTDTKLKIIKKFL